MSPPVDHLKVFVSFSSRDGMPHAYDIAEWLRTRTTLNAGVFVFYERPPGEHFITKIQRAIRECRVLLAVLTPGYAADDSQLCAQEREWAEKLGRKVIPVRMLPGRESPLELNKVTRLDLTTPDSPDWDRLEAELGMVASSSYQAGELDREIDLWADRRPPPGPRRDLFERNILALVEKQRADQSHRLADDGTDPPSPTPAAPRRTRSGDGPGARILSAPPPVPPTEFQNRVDERVRLLAAVRAGKKPVVLVTGGPGAGKTAILSKLAEALGGPDGAGVDWFAYLPAFGQLEVSPATVLGALARMADGDDDDGPCQEILRDGDVDWRAAAEDILDRLGEMRVVLALDNIERILDDRGRLSDVELGRLLHAIRARSLPIIVVVASSSPIDLEVPDDVVEAVRLDEGLRADDGAAFLRSMDPHDLRGLRKATNADRRYLSDVAEGHPRTLELMAALLFCEPALTVRKLINELGSRRNGGQPAAYLMDRILNALPELDRNVLTALAVFGQPVLPEAIDYLLDDYLPNVRSKSTLELLCARRVIRANDGRYLIPSADDAEIVLSSVPRGDPSEYDENEPPEWDLVSLGIAAADYQEKIAVADPRRVEDLRPQFSEVELRIRAGDLNGAVLTIQELDDGWLAKWGLTYLVMPWLRRLEKDLAEPEILVPVLSLLANGHLQLSQYAEAVARMDAAADLVPALPIDRAIEFHVQTGSINFHHKRISAAAQHYSTAMTLTNQSGSWRDAIKATSGLALCATRTGDLNGAGQLYRQARRILSEHPEGEQEFAGDLWINEAWLRGFEGDTDATRRCCEAARTISVDDQVADTTLEGWTFCAEAQLHIDLGAYRKALSAAEQAIARAAIRHDNRLAREATNRRVLAFLCLNELVHAQEEVRFSTAVEERHTALAAWTLRGIVEYRRRDPDARASLDHAFLLAGSYLRVGPESFEVHDLLGVILLIKAIDDPLTYADPMVEEFQTARSGTEATGATRRVGLLIGQVAQASSSPIVELAKTAAASLLPR